MVYLLAILHYRQPRLHFARLWLAASRYSTIASAILVTNGSTPMINFPRQQLLAAALLAIASFIPLASAAADAQRQAEVAERGKTVMPFNLKATTHVFIKTANGGIQRVVAKDAADAGQVRLVRQHLREIKGQFLAGDFAGPTTIHGQEMPGLAQLRKARPGQVAIAYQEVKGGAQLEYKTADAAFVAALHQWFDAQLSDHGSDARQGHMHHHVHAPPR